MKKWHSKLVPPMSQPTHYWQANHMDLINLSTTLSLIERSERTLWRMVAEGTISREIINGKAFFQIDSLKPFFCIPIGNDEIDLIKEADAGDAIAQTDLALIFLMYKKPTSAIYWLELACKSNNPDAMSHLGHCYVTGNGIVKDESLGLIWIARAGSLGHAISKVQVSDMPGTITLLTQSQNQTSALIETMEPPTTSGKHIFRTK